VVVVKWSWWRVGKELQVVVQQKISEDGNGR